MVKYTSRELDTINAHPFGIRVALKNFPLPITRFALAAASDGSWRFDVAIEVAQRDTGKPMELHWAMFFPHTLDEKAVVGQMYLTLQNMLMHELAESWLVDGTRPDDPHGDLGVLSAYRQERAAGRPNFAEPIR